MYHTHKTYLAGPNCQGYEIDVMDYIKCEINIAIDEKKTPMYAPYVMKLILQELPQLDTSRFKKHKVGTLHVLAIHLTPQPTYQERERWKKLQGLEGRMPHHHLGLVVAKRGSTMKLSISLGCKR